MRTVQVSIKIQRFGPNAPNGKEQNLTVYADANNEYEALCAAFYEALDAIQATDNYLPSFGRRFSIDEKIPHKARPDGRDGHLSEDVRDMELKIGDIITTHMARSNSPAKYIILTDLFDGRDERAHGGNVASFADTKKEAAEAAITEKKAGAGRIAILSNYNIPHDCRIFNGDMEIEEFIAKAGEWAKAGD